MNKIVATTVLSLALIGGSVAVAPTASASNGTPGCVTQKEFNKAKKGMTKATVKKLFGTGGKRELYSSYSGYATEIRSYKTCQKYSYVSVTFDKNPGKTLRLSGKSGFWF